MSHADAVTASRGRRSRVVGSLLVAALAVCVLPGVADAKKKRDKVGVMSYNLYLGSDLGPATAAAQASRTDLFADGVGEVLGDVNANDFITRAKQISKDIQKREADLIGLQEAAFWKLQTPTDGSGLNPAAQRATNPVVDYLGTLLEELNRKAKTAKECKKERQEARETDGEKDDRKAERCYRGYELVIDQKEADLEFLGDFDNSPGANGVTFDISNSASLGAVAPAAWLRGNDDPGVSLGEPTPAQCSDGRDNDGDGLTDYGPDPATNEESGPSAGDGTPATGIHGTAAPYECESRLDNSETDVDPAGDPNGLPQDANFDHGALAGHPPLPAPGGSADNGTPFCPGGPSADCPSGVSFDAAANGLDAAGRTDCQDNSADDGPEDGTPGWPFSTVGYAEDTVPVCLFHGIDGDLSLTMRDAIIKRRGAGVKTSNSLSSNFNNILALPLFGGAANVKFTRGYTATDANVRGKRFRFVNTHLESESVGSIRENQASELIAPGGPASVPSTVLVGDLNSDPLRNPVNLPNGDGGSNIAYNRLAAFGFTALTDRFATGGHGELLSNQSDTLGEGQIDHILTNDPEGITAKGSGQVIDTFANGLWNSDHGGVFVQINGKKK